MIFHPGRKPKLYDSIIHTSYRQRHLDWRRRGRSPARHHCRCAVASLKFGRVRGIQRQGAREPGCKAKNLCAFGPLRLCVELAWSSIPHSAFQIPKSFCLTCTPQGAGNGSSTNDRPLHCYGGAWVKHPIYFLNHFGKMAAINSEPIKHMNAISQQIHSPTPPAAFALLTYSAKLLLTESSSATVNRDSSNLTVDNLDHRATPMTITIKSVESYAHYGIND